MKQLSIAIIGLCIFHSNVSAQTTASASHNVGLQLSNAIEVSFVDGASGASLAFSTADNYNNGVIAESAASIRVRSNKSYNVSVKSATANFNSTSATVMPVSSILHVKENTQSTFRSITNTDQNLLTNQSRGVNVFKLTYRATPGFNYDGGTYSVNIIYTATQQ